MSKLQRITDLAADTAREIARPGPYMAFLRTAANNFKYSFRDQLLIHVQGKDKVADPDHTFPPFPAFSEALSLDYTIKKRIFLLFS